MLHLQGPETSSPVIIISSSHRAQLIIPAEEREKETTGCRQWRSPQQPEVTEQPQEQVRGRTEAGRNTREVASQVQEVQVGRHG